ncbi:MAG TPA: ABC transporter ATP-binding protein [Actinomycetota bacterium]|nr:ABC transporter ATP-binding protein [Actinomycetota bacterium]
MSPLSVAAPLHVPVEDRGMPAIDAVELRKEFRRRERVGRRLATTSSVALAPANFRVERGECVAILGQNGSGKSTLVRLLSTLLLPDGGTARVFGHDIRTDARAVRRLVNRVSVEASFFKKLSAFENLSYAARFYGIRAADSRARIPEILERLSFPADRRREPMEHLSRGMQQKVALARALLTAPVLLLLDEPTTGLDPRSKLEVQALVTDMRSQHDATVLLCTHDLAEAEELAGRVGILHRGELIALEPAARLKVRYGAATLEEAFFAATGDRLEDDPDRSTDEGGDSP